MGPPVNRKSSVTSSVADRLDELSAKLENSVTKEYMDSIVFKLKEDIQTEIQRQNEELVNSFKLRINTLESENEELKDKVSLLEQRQCDSDYTINDLECKFNDLEQQGRKNSVRISGLHDPSVKESVEDCVKKVVEFSNTKLGVSLRPEDIDIAHRLGKFDNSRKRTVIVKLTHRTKKQELVRARRILKGTGLIVSEDLTRFNQQRLSEAFRLDCVQNSYSIDGKLFVVLKNGKRRRLFYSTKLTKSYLENDANFNYSGRS
ncbi:uncharacterized protein LOC117320790 [Pecten maximus]|uniref:uncharacterized protein LOC117320790 n=1 Tax=Pecten maximus TaxID=6579 RepID=UPI00145911D1|nr:uncharacterized protein LOC117320790 [Pecten maximus]